ncbi:HNH endonuclease [Nitrosopumilus sp. K4]|uniref:HNH endonuclease n=1 Tax=Nitrosopumilus sp. K4 TaxID=2795383 RepID=UPI0020129DF9|nr:HNH endonuclease signature motif containing protein [Nitrosopumilus sp. K4]
MNGPTRKKIYRELALRDGNFCQFCRRNPEEMQLVIDHIDNDNSNNDRKNLRILCRRCNYVKNPRRPVDECVSENLDEKTELQINRTKEPEFKKYVAHEINERGSVPENELVYSGAEYLGVSPVTTLRYLKKLYSSFGIYQKTKQNSKYFIEYKDDFYHI